MFSTKKFDFFTFYVPWKCEKARLNLYWPVRLKRISRNVFWIGFQPHINVARNRLAKIGFHVVFCRSDYLNMIGFQSETYFSKYWWRMHHIHKYYGQYESIDLNSTSNKKTCCKQRICQFLFYLIKKNDKNKKE